MTATQSLKIFEILQRHFKSSEDAKLVVQEIEEIVEEKINTKKDILLTKDDKVDLIDRIYKAKVETIIWIVGVGVIQFILGLLMKKIG